MKAHLTHVVLFYSSYTATSVEEIDEWISADVDDPGHQIFF